MDPEVRWLRRCQSIWESQSSFKHKVLGCLMHHQGLVDVRNLHRSFVVDMKWMIMSSKGAHLTRHFGHDFRLNLAFFPLPAFLEKPSPWGQLDD